MKKLILVCALATASFIGFAQKGGDDAGRMNVIKVNPLGLLFGSANVSYERAFNSNSAIQGSVSYGGLSVAGTKYTNIGLGVDYKYYFKGAAPTGWYISPGVGFSSVKVKNTIDDLSASGFTVKGVAGHQWIWGSGFSLDLNAGVQYYGVKFDKAGYDKFKGILPALGLSLGYAF